MKQLENLFRHARYWVFGMIFIYFLLSAWQCLPLILVHFGISVNMGFSLPLSVWAWGMTTLSTFYIFGDRASCAVKSAHMQITKMDMGEPQKLQHIIFATSFVVIENYILSFLFSVSLPLTAITTALVSNVVTYVTGNKAIRVCQSVDFTTDSQPWANEHVSDSADATPQSATTATNPAAPAQNTAPAMSLSQPDDTPRKAGETATQTTEMPET